MKIGPKYKIARRLGAAVFEKTQTAKFALAEQKKKAQGEGKFQRPKSVYGTQLIEKQRVKYTYGLTEKQLSRRVREIIAKGASNTAELVYKNLESRLDNVVLRAGFAKTRFQARQMVSHGHMSVNGVKCTIPSMLISAKDAIAVTQSKRNSALYADFENRHKETIVPAWIVADAKNLSITVKGEPVYKPTEVHFDLAAIIQAYKR